MVRIKMKKEYDDGIYEGGINLLTKKRSGYGTMRYNDVLDTKANGKTTLITVQALMFHNMV